MANDYRDEMNVSVNSTVSTVAAVSAPVATRSLTTQGQADAADAAAATVDTMPASPPAEVLDAMRTAAGAQNRLAAAGQTLQFGLDPDTGRLSVTLADLAGNALRSVSPSTVLQVAAGGSID